MRVSDAGDEGLKLADNQGKPLYLFLSDGRPATDNSGTPLRNISGISLIPSAFTKGPSHYQDWKSLPLTDSKGRLYNNKSFCPTERPLDPTPCTRCECQVYAIDGVPLTDASGLPFVNVHGKVIVVFNPKGHPIMDLDGNDITDKSGRILYQKEKALLSKNGLPLRLYDELGWPLTDESGFPFTNILGMPLVVVDGDPEINPIKTVKGYHVRDSEGKLYWEVGFDLTRAPRSYKMNKAIICKNNEHGIAFDVRGHPLTDMNGFPLFDSRGSQLVKKKNVWVDMNCEIVTVIHKSVYDRDELAHLRNSRGTPVRLYDKRGYPLTDHEGTPLVHATGIILIKFNELGEPVSDSNGGPLFDDMGNQLGTKSFHPCNKDSHHGKSVSNYKRCGIQFFEATGMPLTNLHGTPLLNKYQELMAVFTPKGVPVTDVKGRYVYDIHGLPIVKSFSNPLLDPTGEPIRLYNKSGKPLTDRAGNVLKSIKNEYLLKLNCIGQIASDSKGGPLYDSQGYPMSIIDKFLSNKSRKDMNCKILVNLDGSPLCMYDISGEPLTDTRGGILMDCFGKNLITTSISGTITEKNGQPAYDLNGHTAVRVAGRAVVNKIAVFDSNDRPLIGPSGFILKLRTGRELLKFDRAGFPLCTFDGKTIFDCKGHLVFTPLSDISVIPSFKEKIVFDGKLQLFGRDDRPLLDITGAILHTSRGIPLLQLDKDEKPRADYVGRPVYDDTGIPVANPGGVWKDSKYVPYRLFDKDGLPLTDPRGKELLDINGTSLVKRSDYGHPKYDRLGNLVYDAHGIQITDQHFVGTAVPPENKNKALMESPNRPLRLYDLEGMPLTDECGIPLETVAGSPLLDLSSGLDKIVDKSGRTVYDSRKIPLACDPTAPIVTMKGTPMVLYNRDGNPMMSLEGMPIKCMDGSPLLHFDEFGRPSGADDSMLYDACGLSIDNPDCNHAGTFTQQISLMSMEGRTVRIFGKGGRPITDSKGNILFRSDGNPLRAGSWGDFPM